MTWEFEHSVEARAEPARAWQFWTNVENWTLDPAVEWARLDGPFRAGARGTTKQRGQEPVHWQVVGPRNRCFVAGDEDVMTGLDVQVGDGLADEAGGPAWGLRSLIQEVESV